MAKQLKYSRTWFRFLKNTLVPFVLKKHHVSGIISQEVRNLPAPYILCCNHVNFWDPFWLNAYLPFRIHYIVSDSNWRAPLRRWFLDGVGSIPKAKSTSDIRTIKAILQVKQEKGVIGLFPEGIRSWEGVTAPIFFSAAKLIKKIQIPVVAARIKGGFFSKPRWARKDNAGQVEIEYYLAMTAQEVQNMSEEEIHQKITALLSHDEVEFQKTARYIYRGRHKAEGLEYALFRCPQCQSMQGLQGKGNLFSCPDCGNTLNINQHWNFEPAGPADKASFDNIRDWYRWQIKIMEQEIRSHLKKNPSLPYLRDQGAILSHLEPPFRMVPDLEGEAMLNAEALYVTQGEQVSRFPIGEIKAMNVQDDEKLEFNYQDITYRLDFKTRVSAIKWNKSVKYFKELQGFLEPSQVSSM